MEIHQYPMDMNSHPPNDITHQRLHDEDGVASGPCTHRCLDPFLTHLCKVGSGITSDGEKKSRATEINEAAKKKVTHVSIFFLPTDSLLRRHWYQNVKLVQVGPNPFNVALWFFFAQVCARTKLPHLCKCSLIFCSAFVSRVTCRDISHTAFLSLLPMIAT